MSLLDTVVGNLNDYLQHHLNTIFNPYDANTHGSYTLEQKTQRVRGANVVGYVISEWNIQTEQPSLEQLALYTENDVYQNSRLLTWFKDNVDIGLLYAEKRKELLTILPVSGWDGYSDEQKKCLANAFLVDRTKRLEILTLDEEASASVVYHKRMSKCRESVWIEVMAILYNSFSNGKDVVSSVQGYRTGYIEGLDDFMNYLVNDFNSIGFTPYSGNLNDVRNECINKLI